MDYASAISALTSQNEKLQTELAEIKTAMQEAIQKRKSQRKAKNRVPKMSDAAGETSEQQIRRVNARISQHKREIREMEKAINGNLGGNSINDMENHISYLKQRLNSLNTENQGLERVVGEQRQALDFAENTQDYPAKMERATLQLEEKRARYKQVVLQLYEMENKLKGEHAAVVDLEGAKRRASSMYLQTKKGRTLSTDAPGNDYLQELQAEREATISAKTEEEKKLTARLQKLDSEIEERENAREALEARLKEREQEQRINALKTFEMRRIARAHQRKLHEQRSMRLKRLNQSVEERSQKTVDAPSLTSQKSKRSSSHRSRDPQDALDC